MADIWIKRIALFVVALSCVVVVPAELRTQAAQDAGGAARHAAEQVSIDADDIGGVVTSSKGPEAGVWVIAETNELPTQFRKIVVTDDRGRYLLRSCRKRLTGYGCADTA